MATMKTAFIIVITIATVINEIVSVETNEDSPMKIIQPTASSIWVADGRLRGLTWTYPNHASSENQDGGAVETWQIELMMVVDGKASVQLTHPLPAKEAQITENYHQFQVFVHRLTIPGTYRFRVTGSLSKTIGDIAAESPDFKVRPASSLTNLLPNPKSGENSEQRLAKIEKKQEKHRHFNFSAIWRPTHCAIPVLHSPSYEEFVTNCSTSPCLLKGLTDKWPARKKWQFDEWNKDEIFVQFNSMIQEQSTIAAWNKARADPESRGSEIRPMVFEDIFARYPDLLQDYTVPDIFNKPNNLMDILPKEARPDWRWLIGGMKYSSTQWHVDPYNTSAWLALMEGAKHWAFYPPSTYYPPGVVTNVYWIQHEDTTEGFNWWTKTYPHLQPQHRPMECVQEKGDIIFFPGGWWHSVFNLEDTMGVSENYALPLHMEEMLRELLDHGNAPTYERLKTGYSEKYADVFQSPYFNTYKSPTTEVEQMQTYFYNRWQNFLTKIYDGIEL